MRLRLSSLLLTAGCYGIGYNPQKEIHLRPPTPKPLFASVDIEMSTLR
jgi:hypothetical protein